MRTLTGLILIGLLTPSGAVAQVAPYRVDPHRYQVERHQARMDSLRLQADARADAARRLDTDTRLTLRELDDRRQPPTPYVEQAAPPSDPAVTTERHRRTREAVTQIDDWLARTPD
jgi:hypothetical protein